MIVATMRIAGDTSRKQPRRLPFTAANIKAASCAPSVGRIWLYDSRQPGLALMVTSAGAKSFYVYRKVNGRPQRIRLGGSPDISIDQARKLAQKTLATIAAGNDPMAERREARVKGMNVGELWEWFLESWAKPRKKSWQTDESRYDTHLKPWASRRLADLKRTDVAALHQRVSKSASPVTANRVIALLSTMFNKARRIGWEQSNPCQGVEKFAEQSRERFLSPEEIGRFLKALDTDPEQDWQDFFKTCLFSGARRSNVLAMRWEELDLSASRWLIPGEKFKNGKAMGVHLPAPIVEILERRKGNHKEWVFPSGSKSGHLVKPENAWKRLCEKAELTDVRIHDLRRTLGSWQAAQGASLALIGKTLGHLTSTATQIYARLQMDPVAKSVNSAVGAMMAVPAPAAKAEA